MLNSSDSNSAEAGRHARAPVLTSSIYDNMPDESSLLQGINTQFVVLPSDMIATQYGGDGAKESINSVLIDSELVHFACVLQGSLEASLSGSTHTFAKGQGLIGFTPGERVVMRSCPNFRQVGVIMTPETLPGLFGDESERMIRDIERGCLIHKVHAGQGIVHAATHLAQRMQHPTLHPLLLQSAVLEFLGHYFSTTVTGTDVEHIPEREKRLLRIARDRLLQDLAAPPTIEELARETGLSKMKLKMGFRKLFNSSIYGLFQRHRIDHAHDLLRNHNVTETALLIGYSNISHFSSAYRKQFGVLPSYTRKKTTVS